MEQSLFVKETITDTMCPQQKQSQLFFSMYYKNYVIQETETRSPASAGIANRPLVCLGRHLILYSKSRFMNNS